MMNKSESAGRSRQEPLGALALCLAFALMALPVESDVLWTLHRIGLVWLDRVVWTSCFVVVLLLLVFSRYRIHRDPGRWHGGFVNIFTACILVLNILQALVALHYHAL